MRRVDSSADTKLLLKVAGFELNALNYAEVIPRHIFENSRVSDATPIYDINGEVLFHRFNLKTREGLAFADISLNSVFSSPLLAVSYGQQWSHDELARLATAAARKQQVSKFDEIRFVCYSYPKVAVQFLLKGEEVAMLELYTWQRVPAKTRGEGPPGNFERWSIIEETPERVKRKNSKALKSTLANLEKSISPRRKFDFRRISSEMFVEALPRDLVVIGPITDSRELHYSSLQTDHHVCYELRGQITNVWCVAASVQMLLDFYRYDYEQTRLATELGLGTTSNPNGLPYANDGDVVTVIERMTSNALDASMNTSPNWTEFRNEIRANRPLVSFIPGHSRTVVGYTATRIFGWYQYRGLLVYDPWPPSTGVITRWENFDANTYRRTFTAHVNLV